MSVESCSDSERIFKKNVDLSALFRANFLGGFSALGSSEPKLIHLHLHLQMTRGAVQIFDLLPVADN